ncbi:MAG: adenylate kinase [Pseudonocardiales bacterium]
MPTSSPSLVALTRSRGSSNGLRAGIVGAVRESVSSAPSRILVYGVTGSGKSVLAERIGTTLNLPWYSVDDLTWEPGWVPAPVDDQRIRISAICARKCWVLDSAYGKWLDIPLSRAELIVGLDYPRWFSLARLIRRTIRRMIRRDVVCNGNQESLRLTFSRDSIIVWHFQSFKRKQRRMREWRADPDRPPVLLFRSPRATRAWLQQLGEPGSPRIEGLIG